MGVVVGSFAAHIPRLQQDLNTSPGPLGAAFLFGAVGLLLGMSLAPGLDERWGAGRVAWMAGIVYVLWLAAPLEAPSVSTLGAIMLAGGVACGVMDVAMNVAAVRHEQQMGRPVLSGVHGWYSLGALVGAAGGALAFACELRPMQHAVFVDVLCLTALCVAVPPREWRAGKARSTFGIAQPDGPSTSCEVANPHRTEQVDETARLASEWSAEPSERRAVPVSAADTPPEAHAGSGRRLGLAGLAFACMLSEGALTDWSGVLMSTATHDPSATPLAYAGFALGMTCGRFFGNALTRRWGDRRLNVAGGALATLGLIAALAHPPAAIIPLGCAFVGLGLSNQIPILFRWAGGAGGGRGLAFVTGVGYVGFLVGPPLIGLVAERLGIRAGLLIVGGCLLLLTLGSPRAAPATKRRFTDGNDQGQDPTVKHHISPE